MKCRKRLMSLVLALVMIFSLTTGASAATVENIKVQLRPDVTVKLDNKTQVMTDANGNPVYPIMNGGTTYLPVRAVSNMLGVGVDWDGKTQTVLLDTGKTPAASSNTTAKTGTGTGAKVSDITVQLRPDVTVKLDNKTQTMADANGNAVYPIMNGGTTYLPVRAVSNMLSIEVGWDGATQTVLLTSENNAAGNGSVIVSPDAATVDKFFKEHGLTGVTSSATSQITISNPSAERIRKTMEMRGYPDYAIDAAIAEFEKNGLNGDNGNGTFTYKTILNKKDTFKTSDNTRVVGNTHIANDYVEVDLSTANDGYVRVNIVNQTNSYASCSIDGANVNNGPHSAITAFRIKPGQWTNIQLSGKSDYYQLTVTSASGYITNVAFITTVENPNGWALASDAKVDFENAPKTVAKAAELTKNCKTEAEKITAIFEFVAKTVKYDDKLLADEDSGKISPDDRNLNPDHILDTKTGVCEHYAVLMAAMLRSQGIPCKVISGNVYQTKTGWGKHAWVAVRPDTKGLDMTRLGAGHEPDGWIRLDPTWGGTPSGRADAAIDKNHKTEYTY